MPLTISCWEVTIRLVLACIASFAIGLNRDEKGNPAGIRTTMLVCLAATLSMIQVNLMLDMSGKTPSSFAVMDLMRLPLGILSGIGFIGAGVIVKRDNKLVAGVTTAATMWFVTVLGLLFGGGNCVLGAISTGVAIVVLWGLKGLEGWIPREHRGTLTLSVGAGELTEEEIRRRILGASCRVATWKAPYEPAAVLASVESELTWRARGSDAPHTPDVVHRLRDQRGVLSVRWDQE